MSWVGACRMCAGGMLAHLSIRSLSGGTPSARELPRLNLEQGRVGGLELAERIEFHLRGATAATDANSGVDNLRGRVGFGGHKTGEVLTKNTKITQRERREINQ